MSQPRFIKRKKPRRLGPTINRKEPFRDRGTPAPADARKESRRDAPPTAVDRNRKEPRRERNAPAAPSADRKPPFRDRGKKVASADRPADRKEARREYSGPTPDRKEPQRERVERVGRGGPAVIVERKAASREARSTAVDRKAKPQEQASSPVVVKRPEPRRKLRPPPLTVDQKRELRRRTIAEEGPTGPHRSGTIAIVGRPNVGKSTLLNTALGEHIAIVSATPQTTRDRILGVVHRRNSEIILLDTPGIHAPYSRLGRALNRTARLAAAEAGIVLFVTSAPTGESLAVHASDQTLLEDVGKDVPTILVVNQIDRVRDKSRLFPFLEEIAKLREFAAVVLVSALRGDGIARLLDEIEKLLPEAPWRFEEDEFTDRPTRFFVGEFVREQILALTHEEVPHAVAIEVERFEDQPKTAHIDVTIHVERDGQKGILIGTGGEKLKAIGTAARLRIEALLEKKVFLKLWVRVTPDWTESEKHLVELGYGKST